MISRNLSSFPPNLNTNPNPQRTSAMVPIAFKSSIKLYTSKLCDRYTHCTMPGIFNPEIWSNSQKGHKKSEAINAPLFHLISILIFLI